jgi:hypothetical protein
MEENKEKRSFEPLIKLQRDFVPLERWQVSVLSLMCIKRYRAENSGMKESL